MRTTPTRRDFIKTLSVTGAGLVMGIRGSAASGYPANEALDIGVIGVAHQGGYNLRGVSSENIVALCDVDDNYLGQAGEQFPKAKKYNDFRKLLEQANLDAVVVSTPDHTHGVAAHAALEAGLDVYCEKPLAHSIFEVRALTGTAVKKQRVTQMGTQIHAGGNYRRVVELVSSGALGPVREVHVWCGKNWGGGDRPAETPPVPEHLHYDLWLGPAPERPYHPVYLPGNWRRWWDFGGGTLADMGCHYIDLAFWALKLKYPVSAAAEGPPVHEETAPEWLISTWEFPGDKDRPRVKLVWYDGGKRPGLFDEGKLPEWGDGVLFVGDEGMLISDYSNHKLLPEDRYADFVRPAPFIPDSIGHHREWIEACKRRGATTCSFDYSGPMTETVLLGLAAYRSGKRLAWDGEAMKVTSDEEALRYIQPAFRKGWEL